MLAGDWFATAHRRGWTHGLPAMVVLPFLVAGVLLLWDRHVRRRRQPQAPPVRASVLLAVAAIGVFSHPVLDWLNNYGMRWLMPFDDRWFYGDALFIIDPWVWLALGGAAVACWSSTRAALCAWAVFWALASGLVLTSALVPLPAKGAWIAGLLAVGLVRWRAPRAEPVARLALVGVALYMGASIAANAPAREEVRAALQGMGLDATGDVMVSPVPADPLAGFVVAETAEGYMLGDWHWRRQPRFEAQRMIRAERPGDVRFDAASAALPAQRFLSWARFPYAQVDGAGDGWRVRFGDARYANIDAGVGIGPTVYLDASLQVSADEAALTRPRTASPEDRS